MAGGPRPGGRRPGGRRRRRRGAPAAARLAVGLMPVYLGLVAIAVLAAAGVMSARKGESAIVALGGPRPVCRGNRPADSHGDMRVGARRDRGDSRSTAAGAPARPAGALAPAAATRAVIVGPAKRASEPMPVPAKAMGEVAKSIGHGRRHPAERGRDAGREDARARPVRAACTARSRAAPTTGAEGSGTVPQPTWSGAAPAGAAASPDAKRPSSTPPRQARADRVRTRRRKRSRSRAPRAAAGVAGSVRNRARNRAGAARRGGPAEAQSSCPGIGALGGAHRAALSRRGRRSGRPQAGRCAALARYVRGRAADAFRSRSRKRTSASSMTRTGPWRARSARCSMRWENARRCATSRATHRFPRPVRSRSGFRAEPVRRTGRGGQRASRPAGAVPLAGTAPRFVVERLLRISRSILC